jgi:hypothetical protein
VRLMRDSPLPPLTSKRKIVLLLINYGLHPPTGLSLRGRGEGLASLSLDLQRDLMLLEIQKVSIEVISNRANT